MTAPTLRQVALLRAGIVLLILSAIADMVHMPFTFVNFGFNVLAAVLAGFLWAISDTEAQ